MSDFFRMLRLSAFAAQRHPAAIRQLRAGELEGILLQDVYDAAACARVCARLAAGRHSLPQAPFPPKMGGYFLGSNLNLAEPRLASYFDEATLFHEDLEELFAGLAALPVRVATLLSQLDAGRPYQAAPGPRPGQTHMFTTLRAHPPGAFIPPHFDNEQAFRQSYRYLTPQIGPDPFAFVLALSRADSGGALQIFDIRHDGRPWRMAEGAHDAEGIALDRAGSVSLRLAPGELIVFNSSRLLHRVTPVAGAAVRWTACSFLAESRDGAAVYCWG